MIAIIVFIVTLTGYIILGEAWGHAAIITIAIASATFLVCIIFSWEILMFIKNARIPTKKLTKKIVLTGSVLISLTVSLLCFHWLQSFVYNYSWENYPPYIGHVRAVGISLIPSFLFGSSNIVLGWIKKR